MDTLNAWFSLYSIATTKSPPPLLIPIAYKRPLSSSSILQLLTICPATIIPSGKMQILGFLFTSSKNPYTFHKISSPFISSSTVRNNNNQSTIEWAFLPSSPFLFSVCLSWNGSSSPSILFASLILINLQVCSNLLAIQDPISIIHTPFKISSFFLKVL